MKNDTVREKLQNLYDELRNTRSNDRPTQEKLHSLAADIKHQSITTMTCGPTSTKVLWTDSRVLWNILKRPILS